MLRIKNTRTDWRDFRLEKQGYRNVAVARILTRKPENICLMALLDSYGLALEAAATSSAG